MPCQSVIASLLEGLTQVEQLSEVRSKEGRYDDLGNAEVDKVNDKHWDAGKRRNKDLVPPPDVEEIVANAEDYNDLEGYDGRQIRR
jgi:hypothetical protein